MIDQTRLELLCAEVILIAREIGKFIHYQIDQVSANDIITKEHNSLVSYVDTTAEQRLVKALTQILPEAGFITEENTIEQALMQEMVWIIDPLDGTTNYLQRIPHYSTSIALQVNGEILLGVVSDISQDKIYHAIKGGGACCNGTKVKIASKEKISEAIIATGFPYNRDLDFDTSIEALVYFVKHARGMRRLGSAALDLVYVASGKLDAYYESNLNIWDVAAGNLIVEEAGGIVTDYNGGDTHLMGKSMIAANPNLHSQVSIILSEIAGGSEV